jgi:L-alanine-DL-glutamate epimerase-like enolase superfamily enzyme
LDLIARRRGVPLWRLLARAPVEPLAVSALVLVADPERTAEEARRLVARGYRTLKRKLGGPSRLDDDRRALAALRDAVGDSVRLRLDANGSFSTNDAPAVLRTLAPLDVEFVEEPVPTGEIAALREADVPLAFDESLGGEAWRTASAGARFGPWIAAVLKPTVLGGLVACCHLATRLRSAGIAVTVSHAFEGPIALAAAAHLALAVADRTHASGIARHVGLGAWPDVPLEGFGEPILEPPDRAGLGLDAARVAGGSAS